MTEMDIVIHPEPKKEKVRWGLYIDRDVHDEVMAIANRSGVSYNNAINHIIRSGIKALRDGGKWGN